MNSTLRVVPMFLLLGACDDRSVTTARPPIQNLLAEAPEGAGMVARRCAKDDGPFFAGTLLASNEDWYGGQLRAMGERPLCQGGDQPATVYRLTWIPSFHPSVTVRIAAGTNSYVLTGKILSGAGYEPGSVARDTTITLGDADVSVLSQLLAQARFWEQPTIPPPDGTIRFDGAQFNPRERTAPFDAWASGCWPVPVSSHRRSSKSTERRGCLTPTCRRRRAV